MMTKAFNAMRTSTHAKLLATTALGASLMLSSVAAQAELSANASITNNYLWRGLTQSVNLPATQGGIDYSADNGFYVGTWISNVEYDAGDAFSYEHDVYFGYSGEASLTSMTSTSAILVKQAVSVMTWAISILTMMRTQNSTFLKCTAH